MGARSLVKVREEAPAQPSQVLSLGRIAAENPLLRDGTGVERERARDRDGDVRRDRVGEDIPEVAEQVRRVHRMAYHAVGAAQLEAAVRSHEAEAPREACAATNRAYRAARVRLHSAEPSRRPAPARDATGSHSITTCAPWASPARSTVPAGSSSTLSASGTRGEMRPGARRGRARTT